MGSSLTVPTTRAYRNPDSGSARLFADAVRALPGGNTRTTLAMQPHPIYATEGHGCWVTDADGERRLDLLNNYTSLIHGHAHPTVTEAAVTRVRRGTAFSLPTPEEVQLAALLTERLPGVDQIRFCNSGSEAVMTAVKAARGFTGRPRIAKFEGAYHGSYDWAEVSLSPPSAGWGSLEAPESVAYCQGTPASVLAEVVVLPFNRPDLVARRLDREGADIAAVVIDPLPNRAGLIPASEELLRTLREVTSARGILLVFDEVISFRLGYHGAQGEFGVRPDLTALGKIMGGGFAVGAVGGRADVMAVFDPRGGKPRVPHAGTFNANPVTMAAGLAAMRLMDEAAYVRLNGLGEQLRKGVTACFERTGFPGMVTGRGSLFRIHPFRRDLVDYRSSVADATEAARLDGLYRGLLDHGVLIAPAGLGCLSTVMTEAELDYFLEALTLALQDTGYRARA